MQELSKLMVSYCIFVTSYQAKKFMASSIGHDQNQIRDAFAKCEELKSIVEGLLEE